MVLPVNPTAPATGQLMPGSTEHPVSTQMWLQYIGVTLSCTAQIKGYSLLDNAGQPAANRVGHYLLTVNPADGNGLREGAFPGLRHEQQSGEHGEWKVYGKVDFG